MWWLLAILAFAILATFKYYTAFEIQNLVKRIESLRVGRRRDKDSLEQARERLKATRENEEVHRFRVSGMKDAVEDLQDRHSSTRADRRRKLTITM